MYQVVCSLHFTIPDPPSLISSLAEKLPFGRLFSHPSTLAQDLNTSTVYEM